ncbi:MAG: signal peptide peptidase SppA [Bacteroidetes bacterium]|nr:signal peptide peptidase SppA [Bacteroidota bacterium]
MKQFFKFMLASMAGFTLTIIIVFFLLIGLIASLLSFAEQDVEPIGENTVLYINLNQTIYDRGSNSPLNSMDLFSLKPSRQLGLNEILESIYYAKQDSNIDGIYLELSSIPAGISTIEEIRNALIEFKKSGKFVISYSEYMTQSAYYLASVSDKIYHNPEGIFLFKGLSAQVMYYKGLLEKLDVEAQVIKHGDYKSAVEPYLRKSMSKENEEQTQNYLDDVWDHMLANIAQSRDTDTESLNKAAEGLIIQSLDKAIDHKLIDGLKYRDEILSEIKELLGIGSKDDINSVSLSKYSLLPKPSLNSGRDKIAVIYGTGTIMAGSGDDQTMGSARVSRAIRKARLDKRVKAIVFRVNSGGGDVVASEVIRREIELAAQAKPVIASFGDYAASGGYWVSCGATEIMASPVTLTGSIGVYAIFPNLNGLLNDKIGLSFDEVKTNKYADFYTGTRSLSAYEKNLLTNNVEKTYDTFLELVANGRDMKKTDVNAIAGGRIWSGIDAKSLGLIDSYGGLTAAINRAIDLADLDTYRIIELPEQKDPIEQFIEDWTNAKANSRIKEELGPLTRYIQPLKSLTEMKGVQVRLPFEITIE